MLKSACRFPNYHHEWRNMSMSDKRRRLNLRSELLKGQASNHLQPEKSLISRDCTKNSTRSLIGTRVLQS